MAIDSHMHINNDMCNNIKGCIDKVNNDDSISRVINVGVNVPTSRDSYYISQNNPKFYTAIGIHPLYIDGEDIDDLFIVETDSLYLTPEPLRDVNNPANNSSSNLHYIIERIADLKGVGYKNIENITDRNVKCLFKRMK